MHILGIIPARKDSKGIKGKNIKPLGGKPLIQYTFEAAKLSRKLTRIVLSTDSHEIADMGNKLGIEVPFIRPHKLALDTSRAAEYIIHCLDYFKKRENYIPDIVVLLQPTTPFRSSKDIDVCITRLLKSNADAVVSVSALPSKYHPAWQLYLDKKSRVFTFTVESWNNLVPNRQMLPTTYIRNGAVYVFKASLFVKTKSIYGKNVLGYIMPEEKSVNIDDMNDWRKAESVLEDLF